MDNIEEIWKEIEGYEGLYQISNLGNVKSFWYGKERILKGIKKTNGYLQVTLCKEGKIKHFLIHRLVAQAFIPNPNNYLDVNHKDEVKTNNCIENLEWCSREYNTNYGTRTEKCSKEVIQMNLQRNEINRFPSTMEVSRQLGYSNGNISACCLGKRKTAYGYIWRYA